MLLVAFVNLSIAARLTVYIDQMYSTQKYVSYKKPLFNVKRPLKISVKEFIFVYEVACINAVKVKKK